MFVGSKRVQLGALEHDVEVVALVEDAQNAPVESVAVLYNAATTSLALGPGDFLSDLGPSNHESLKKKIISVKS